MKIKKTQFIKSSNSLEDCPKGDFPEFVFFDFLKISSFLIYLMIFFLLGIEKKLLKS